MRSQLIIHPEELSRSWIDRAADAGITVLGIHPKGGKRAPVYIAEMLETMKTQEYCALIDYARGRGLEIEYELHAASFLVPRRLFAENPAIFRVNARGERTPELNFCVTSAEAMQIFAQNAAALADALYGSNDNFYFWLDDCRDSACCCEKCRAYTPSEQQMLAVNAMARAVREKKPHARFAYLAYADSMTPPEKVKPEEGVFLEYAPMEKYKNEPASEAHAAEEEKMLPSLLEFFGCDGAKVLEYWYDNSMFSGWEKPPKRLSPDAEAIARDVAFYREKGFEYISSFACFLGEDYEKLYGAVDISPFAECMKN
ncbi:MAG: DUF4838 domain-containing protein [Ruminococcaceae bacterium]|nr:DUF4838 domain-containing protein [Oscillospiraceae bacterium]